MMSWRGISAVSAAALISLALGCSEPKPPTDIAATSSRSLTAVAGQSVAAAPTVKVTNKDGDGVGGVVVNFTVTAGGGSVGATSVTTGDDGTASTSWTLGTTAGPNGMNASVEGLTGSPVGFAANGVAGAPASITINAGDGQSATVGQPVLVHPSVRVIDANGNPVSNTTVTFAVTGGGGSITGGTATTTTDGLATLSGWTLGPNPGANTLSASVTGLSPIVFTATGQVAPPLIAFNAGDRQAAMVSTAVATLPSVILTQSGSPVVGASVTFSVLSGGGVITGATTTTNASGIATVGSWTLGAGMGLNTLQATVNGLAVTGGPIIFSASGCDGTGAGFRITLCFTAEMTASQKAAFTAAATQWERVITGDLGDVSLSPSGLSTSSCGGRAFAMPGTTIIDDVLIFATIEPIDGPSNILGSAGPCIFRSVNGLTAVGAMRFDVADVGGLSASSLNAVILHEMGHVLGIGSLWGVSTTLPTPRFPFLVNPSSNNSVLDTYYNGANGIAGFDAIGGNTYTGGNKVPVENTGGNGTVNSHWRESVLANELMTGFLNSNTVNPLSVLTVGALQDLGYTVNLGAADPFTLALTLRAPGSPAEPTIKMHNDVDTFPVFSIDSRGRLTRIR